MVAAKFLSLFTRGEGVSDSNRDPVNDASNIELPDGQMVSQIGSTCQKWVDDFGGSALDTSSLGWDVYDGGTYDNNTGKVSGVNGVALNLLNGSGITGITYLVTNSELRVTLGTTANAELWFVSKQMFTNPVDFYLSMLLSQRIVNNTMYFEFVECDPVTGVLVPHSTVSGEVRNRGGIAVPSSATGAAYNIESTCDDSGLANSSTTTTGVSLLSAADLILELRPQDLILNGVATDTLNSKNTSGLRMSRQVPDPNKTYKLRMRFKNGGVAPASSTLVTIYRTLICDVQEIIAEVSSGRGEVVGGKGIPVNIVPNSAAVSYGYMGLGAPITGALTSGTQLKVISAATTNGTNVSSTANKRLTGGHLSNNGASWAYFKVFNKASAPVVGTDTPREVYGIPPGGVLDLTSLFGTNPVNSLGTGLGYAITGAPADLDTTAVAANQVVGTIYFI